MSGHRIPILLEHPLEQHTLLCVVENGGVHSGIEVPILLKVSGHLCPVRIGGVVVHNVVVLVPHVVVAIDDGNGVDILIAGIGLLHEGVPQVGDGAQQDAGLHVGEEPIHHCEDWVPPKEQQGDTVVGSHSEQQLLDEPPFLSLDEQRKGAESSPIKGKPGDVQKEGQGVGSVQVQVGVDIVDIVVPTMVDLHVGDVVVPGHDTVEGANPPFHSAIQDLEDAFEEATVGMPFLVGKGVNVCEELKTWAHSNQVVDAHSRKFKTVVGMALEGPEEEARCDSAQPDHPRQVGMVAGVAKHELAKRSRDAAHQLWHDQSQFLQPRLAPFSLQQLHQGNGNHDLNTEDRGDEQNLDETPRKGHGVGQILPREWPPILSEKPLAERLEACRKTAARGRGSLSSGRKLRRDFGAGGDLGDGLHDKFIGSRLIVQIFGQLVSRTSFGTFAGIDIFSVDRNSSSLFG
mmetsp:Transcript_26103/g.55479  ORF Transcript_26103/g.55479 Transcript_26103/m.55479 type:complete len:459 (-) Transcript_26103:215-1591(-)